MKLPLDLSFIRMTRRVSSRHLLCSQWCEGSRCPSSMPSAGSLCMGQRCSSHSNPLTSPELLHLSPFPQDLQRELSRSDCTEVSCTSFLACEEVYAAETTATSLLPGMEMTVPPVPQKGKEPPFRYDHWYVLHTEVPQKPALQTGKQDINKYWSSLSGNTGT